MFIAINLIALFLLIRLWVTCSISFVWKGILTIGSILLSIFVPYGIGGPISLIIIILVLRWHGDAIM